MLFPSESSASPARPFPELASFLEAQEAEITQVWLRAVRENPFLPRAGSLSDASLSDHLPQLFRQLTQMLRGEGDLAEVRKTAELHGQHRWHQQYELVEVGRELHVSSRLILSLGLDAFADAHPEFSALSLRQAREAVLAFFEEAGAGSVREYDRRRFAQIRHLAEQREQAMRAARLGWWHYDLVTGQVTWDGRFAEIFGKTESELRYEEVINCLHPDDRARIQEAVAAATRPISPQPYSVQYRTLLPDGQIRWVSAKGQAHFAGEGPARHAQTFSGTILDITETKMAQEALGAEQERHRLALEGAQLGTFSWDFRTDTVHWNTRMKEIFFLPPEATPSFQLALDRIHPADQEPTRLAVEAALSGHGSYTSEYRVLGPDGSQRWVLATGRVHREESTGQVVELHGVARDVTAAREALEEARLATEQVRQTLESITEGFYALDAQWRFTYLNPAALEHLGEFVAEPRKLVGRSYWEVFPEARGTPIETEFLRARHEHVTARFETFYEPWQRWYAVNIYPTPNGGFSIFFRDFSAEKAAAETLRASEAKYRSLFSSLDEGFAVLEMIWDDRGEPQDYRFLEVNPAFTAHTGITHALGRTAREFFPNLEDYWIKTYGEVARTGEATRFVLPSPEIGRTFDVYAFRIGTPEQPQVALLFRDVTERERSERTLREAMAQAEATSRTKDEFLATLSHELRTPLSAILGWTQILRSDSSDPQELQEGLETIERNARAQTQIIEDLLDMSRIISGKVRLEMQLLELGRLVRGAVETIRPTAEAKGVRLLPALGGEAYPIHGDPNRLQQVLWNLLTNAVKFTPKGGVVQVVLERVGTYFEIRVIDSGEGIAPEFLPHVFDRFRQQDATTTRRHGGLGLGLAIVKQLTELHGGRVSVTSGGAGRGSTFRVELPPTAILPVSPESEAGRAREPEITDPTLFRVEKSRLLEGVRALVVDDEPDARHLIQRLLRGQGATVREAGSVAEALRLFLAEPPQILVSDIGMPEADGYSLIRQIRALPAEQGGQIPAVALTAYARSEDRLKALQAGFQMHVVKPVEAAELVAVVQSLVHAFPR